MSSSIQAFSNFRVKFVFLALLSFLFVTSSQAADSKFAAQLIWGSNEEKSPDPTHKQVDPALKAKLQKVFKWKNYFLVTNVVSTIPAKQSRKLTMSEHCVIEITPLEPPSVELKLHGDGKPVQSMKKAMPPGEIVLLAGDDKNETAWFVVVQTVDPKKDKPQNEVAKKTN
jgi:hypothetical protein